MTDAEFDQYIELTPEEESLRDEDFCAYCNTLHRLEGSFKNLIRRSLPEAMALKQKALGLFRTSRTPAPTAAVVAPVAPPPPPRPATTFQPAPVMTETPYTETAFERHLRQAKGMAEIQSLAYAGRLEEAEKRRVFHDKIDRYISESSQPSEEELRNAFINSIVNTASQHRR